ncbi:MAG: DUF2520 domain-containing protein [Planctomycetes bacterium]|nr:DUF2520 domain-containing protein [Planctomycetota bacterium]
MTAPLHLLGAGRAGRALARALHARGLPLGAIANRSARSSSAAARSIGAGTPAAARDAFLPGATTLIGVPEGELAPLAVELAEQLPDCAGAIALHLSGALSAEVLAPLRSRGIAIGSLHPLAAFAALDEAPRDFTGVTFDLDGDPTACAAARALVAALGGVALELGGGGQRDGKPLFHAAACTVSNAAVALFELAEQLAARAGAPPDVARAALVALSRSTLDNLARLGAPAALTGPIERGEVAIVAAHLAALARTAPELLPAYRDFARATLATARRSGRLAPAAAAALDALLCAD